MNILEKLLTGSITIAGERLKYALIITTRSRGTDDRRSYEIYDATFTAANHKGEIVDQFSREFSCNFGRWNDNGIRRSMVVDCHDNFS